MVFSHMYFFLIRILFLTRILKILKICRFAAVGFDDYAVML
jgi:hypothetical protein